MYFERFSAPDPAYLALVTQLYGAETGDSLYAQYRRELANRAMWGERLDWAGIAVFSAGEMRAHAVAQIIRDRPLVYVGYVESVDDRDTAAFLIQAVRAEVARSRPGATIYLPVNLSIWHTYRFKLWGTQRLPFDPPSQPYYHELFAGLFAQQELYSSYRMAVPQSSRLEGIRPPATVRQLSVADLARELQIIYELSVAAFQDAHSVPSFMEFAALYSGAAGRVNPRYILLAEAQGQPVGFIYAITEGGAFYIKTFGVAPSA